MLVCVQVAARMAGVFTSWRKFDPARQDLMKAQLDRMAAANGLSDNVREILTKTLA